MRKKSGKRKKWLIALLLLVLLLPPWLWWQNNGLQISRYTFQSEEVSPDIDGLRIVHLSDLQSKWYGDKQRVLSEKVADLQPDLIVFSGDLMDSNHFDPEAGYALMEQLIEIAPVYFSSGNHEHWTVQWPQIKTKLKDIGVSVMDAEHLTPAAYPDVTIYGLGDPVGYGMMESTQYRQSFELDDQQLNILLSHRPELVELYQGFDLVFAGHAHGGQARLPFVGGIIAPNQGWFPEYDGGQYELGKTTMFVSRGLGNSLFPFRFLNRPEIIVVDLRGDL